MVTDEEMEHYLWFPELYCKRCSKKTGGGMCETCLDKEIEEAEIAKYMKEMYENSD